VSRPRVLVTFSPSPEIEAALLERLDGLADLTYLPDEGPERAAVLGAADVVLAWSIDNELSNQGDLARLKSARLIQLLSAGVDHVPFDRLPDSVPVASNAGAYSEAMSEHVLAMALALAKRLPQNHRALSHGEFDQHTPSLQIRGSVVGVLGFGGIGQATARLFGALGARVQAVNRSGRTDEPVDWVGPLGGLEQLLRRADVLVVSLPLTRETRGLIGQRQLSLMKPHAILVNVARAAIIDEDALYEHLRSNPSFSAGIDAWWQEPLHAGSFATRHPFLDLPNVLGSPHNSAITKGSLATAAAQAAENVARQLRGQPVEHIIDRSEYVG
jgi:phosphoglycerate dehydrogenase-like enzyme